MIVFVIYSLRCNICEMMRPFRGVRKAENLSVAAAVLTLTAGCGSAPAPGISGPALVRDAGYVSSDTCRACHPGQYASWHGSYHRTMTQVATPDTVAASFDGQTVDAVPGEPMVLEQKGQQLWAEFVDPDAGSDLGLTRVRPLPATGSDPGLTLVRPGVRGRIKRQVVLATGSHNQQIYWYATGRSRILGQLPAIWLPAERRWIPRRSAVMRPPGGQHAPSETGAWNGICVACHSTNGQPQFDTPFGSQPIAAQRADTRAAEFGVSCETCHGPAETHARVNRNALRRYTLHLSGRPDSTIVQPMRLNPRLSSQVCAQCHSFWEFPDARSERDANTHGLPYRPGDELSATRFIVQPTRNLESPTLQAFLADDPGFLRDIFWPDGMIRATGREYNGLIESPCYKNATSDARTLTCFSCHSMHTAAADARAIGAWADDQLAPRAGGNDACVQCHEKQSSAAHTHHRPESAGSSCYNCHMPYTTYGLLKTIRSHQISSPSVRTTLDTGRPNACNLCHLDKTLAWTAESLEQWYRIMPPGMGDDERRIAASLLALLKGDAGQRAIAAQAMGWAPAQEASGSGWLTPYLALLSRDSYDAVRHIAARSMATLPPFSRDRLPRGQAQLLINADGTFDAPVVDRLVRARDNRRVVYRE
jgi:Cytochrome c552